jgi:hypothetical protein
MPISTIQDSTRRPRNRATKPSASNRGRAFSFLHAAEEAPSSHHPQPCAKKYKKVLGYLAQRLRSREPPYRDTAADTSGYPPPNLPSSLAKVLYTPEQAWWQRTANEPNSARSLPEADAFFCSLRVRSLACRTNSLSSLRQAPSLKLGLAGGRANLICPP